MVRTTITCATIHSLREIFAAIQADPDFRILRCKNRYDPLFTSSDGYRDVALLVASESVTDNFVCEVQLNLECMYLAKSDGGHSRYIQMRDSRGD